MSYRFVPFPMTWDDLAGHSPVAGLVTCISTNIYATFCTVLTDTARRAVPRRLLSFLYFGTVVLLASKQHHMHHILRGSASM